MTKKQKIIFLFIFLAVFIALGIFLRPHFFESQLPYKLEPRVLEEHVTLPDTKKVSATDGRVTAKAEYDVSLNPKNDGARVIIPNAVLTLKGSFDASSPKAKLWSDDAKLVFIKSLGTVTLEGKSSAWQVVFGSKKKHSGYEAIVQGNTFLSGKEVESDSSGFDVPANWYDSNEAIASLQSMPQFRDAAISSLSLYYNLDGKRWGYVFSTSRGATSMPVK